MSKMKWIEIADESPESLYELFEAKGWGDGLPLVAPTSERVESMLSHSSLSPDKVLAVLEPRGGIATVRDVAVNAVLAGCRPEYLPVLLTAIEALGRPALNIRGVNATTHPVAPLLIVHGPLGAELGFNSGTGAFGPGTRANATVGRALRLVLLHLAGARLGTGDVSSQGQPAKYSYCIAENADESPWPAYHHSVGVEAVNAVTIHCGEGPHNFHDMESEEPGPVLDKAASVAATLGNNNGPVAEAEFFVCLGPEHAQMIASFGWTRDDVASYLFERARLPAKLLRTHFESHLWPPWMDALNDSDLQPLVSRPDQFRVLVVGGPGKQSCLIPSWGVTKSQTEPIIS